MPKRFTDTEKWKKQFIRALKAPYKLFWLYLLDECDSSGLWQVDFEVAQLKVGEKLKETDAIKLFGDKIVILDAGEKWFIPSFIEFQYGQLSENNRAHSKAIQTLKKYNLLAEDLTIKPLVNVCKPLDIVPKGAKEEDKEEEEDKEMEEEQEEGREGEILDQPKVLVFPWPNDDFKRHWSIWKDYKKQQHKFIYKSIITEQGALNELSKLAGGHEQTAIASIHHTIGNGWKGFVLKKYEGNGQQTNYNGKPDPNNLNADLKRMVFAELQNLPGQT